MKRLDQIEARAMPGPPEYVETGSLGDWDSEDRWCNNWDLYWADGRVQYGVWERPDKRLSDAECEAEWDHAEESASACHLFAALGDKRMTPWQLERQTNAAATWHRFATLPHALEGQK